MSTGQHRRSGEPLRERLTKLMTTTTGTHRRRKQDAAEPADTESASQAEENAHVDYRHHKQAS
ncbi:MAG: hypothetical protein GEV07_04860 [Streptosporangiales bacterium]|nr:hypothetical protein [Streptosporangiales bacterium]